MRTRSFDRSRAITGAVAVMAAFALAFGPSPLDAQTGTLTAVSYTHLTLPTILLV